MAESIKQQKVILVEDALRTEIVINQALIDILITKQIISEEELIKSIGKIRYEQQMLMDGET